MSDIVIRAEGLGKKYLIGHQTERERYTALRDVLARNVQDYWRKAKALARGEPIMPGDEQEEIWALREVSFEIRQGEAVGIIGRNGAGKSTLLKILSRITEPSAGRVTIRGRVASLLEVGTGFHPELTGRENIFLNGAILGMTRHEIKRKFDEIVDFAEVEKFLDTPVKRYSSGMYVRLAFAVAAHLEPEILVVDEVLAVGDAAFQKKCLGKMGNVAKGGRTVLFVSHNMAAIQGLCRSCCLLNQGELHFLGQTKEVIDLYLTSNNPKVDISLADRKDRTGSGRIRFTGASLVDRNGNTLTSAMSGQDIVFGVSYCSTLPYIIQRLDIHITFYTLTQQFLFTCSSEAGGNLHGPFRPKGTFYCRIPRLPLAPGRYSYNLYATVAGEIADWILEAGFLDVIEGDFFGTGSLKTHRDGFLVDHDWSLETCVMRV